MRCGHLTYDSWIWLKITSLSSTASVNDNRISLEIPTALATAYGRRQKFVWAEHSAMDEGENWAYGPTLDFSKVHCRSIGGCLYLTMQ